MKWRWPVLAFATGFFILTAAFAMSHADNPAPEPSGPTYSLHVIVMGDDNQPHGIFTYLRKRYFQSSEECNTFAKTDVTLVEDLKDLVTSMGQTYKEHPGMSLVLSCQANPDNTI